MNLKEAYEPYFKVGAAISRKNLRTPADLKFLTAQFNSFTCENEMKPMYYLDRDANKDDPDKYDLSPALNFDTATPFLEFAKENGISMRGHTLVWHNQTPKWFFCEHYNENFPYADRDKILKRLENYIKGVLEYTAENFPGVIYAWDVVNEAVDEGDIRKSLWTATVGEDYVIKAFEFARKYAAPGVLLFYNDYETALDWKRDFIYEHILKPLSERKLVDGMGMQSHLLMDHPGMDEYRAAFEKYGKLGLQIHITELDMHNADPGDESMHALAERYRQVFELYLDAKRSGVADITCVTFWNLRDEESWLSGFRRETSYPLLFRGKFEAKEAYYAVLEAAVSKEDIDKWEFELPEEDFKTQKKPGGGARKFRMNIWKEGEYDYAAAYGFEPFVFGYIHDDDEKRDCMLVVPGGGYCMVVAHEGELAAKEFYDRGMNVFVLVYTTDITMSVPLKIQPLRDISRAVRWIRKHAAEYNIDVHKLFACGFSAGGHVCGSLAVHYADIADDNPEYSEVSNKPDGVILSYPVITAGEYTHEDSIHALLGFDPSDEDIDYFSLEKHVSADTPPCFLWQTEEDALVPVENTYLFAMALRKNKVPFAHFVFPAGFHGLSVANKDYFQGWSGGFYTMEQTWRAVGAVKEGKGINVSEKRREELTEQFFGGKEEPANGIDMSLREDVGLWTDLASTWMKRI
ncbi:MAG: endo-1,4-beta-xylanase [Lachnospiraceae bacterium]|nr:endo-1,4-beta-xylanase [Lachnospiraceae bacterium]